MSSRSSSPNTSERASALNAAAASFSPTQRKVLQPANFNMPRTGSDAADSVPDDYAKNDDDTPILNPDALAGCAESSLAPFPLLQLEREGIEREMFHIQRDAMGLHSAYRLEVEKLTLGVSLEIEQLKKELNAIRSLNGNGNGDKNGDENAAEDAGRKSPASTEKENRDVNGSNEEAENPDVEAVVGKKIIAFLRLTRDAPYPHRLYGKSNYSIWRESILSIAESTGCNHIIENGQKFSPFTDENTYLWDQQNDWLYGLIWDSIDSKAMESVTQPKRHSAYLLWNLLESAFRRPLEEERRSLFHSLYPSEQTSDREYIKKFQEVRRKLEKLGFPVPDWLLYDILFENISKSSRKIIHANFTLKQEETPKSVPQTLDIDTLIDELVACLPPEGNILISTISNSDGNTDLSSATLPSTPNTAISRGIGSTTANSINDNDNVSTHSGTTTSISKKKNGKSQQWSTPKSTDDNKALSSNTNSSRTDESSEPRSKMREWCESCTRWGHTESTCYIKHPELAPEHWRRQNQKNIELLRHKGFSKGQQQRNQNFAPQAPRSSSQTRGRGRQNGNNYSNNNNSTPESGSPHPDSVNMSHSIQAIARQFYEQMENDD
ncbi:hypothetical protein AJ78_04177 [Emergomyces pasteurianus Ep9510]|uniref:Uncharacterized protein n=1 Tax=Emergomyces pasteurianus Ep9510 TaxID=1447872 RepID=A0A1J9Q5T8_9EURO|nr:hypothetical protein AJ78_04177 [Emergomyces pasteurianus Ep9510]